MMKKPDAKKAPPSPPPEPGSRARRRHGTRYGPATACRTVVMYARTACALTDRGRQAPSGQELLHGRVPAFPRAPDRVPRAFGRTSSGLKNSSIYQTICQVLPVISSNPRSWDTSPKITPVRRAVRHVGRAYGRQGGSPPPLSRYRSPSRTDSRTPGAAPSCRLGQPGYDVRTDGLAAGHSIPAEGSLVPAQGLRDAGLRRQRYVRNAS